MDKNEAKVTGCNNAPWFGWNPDGEASISYTFNGTGKAVLSYGNCYTDGKVVATFNSGQEEIKSEVDTRSGTKFEFEFQHGKELKISELGSAIIRFDNLEIVGCASGM